MEAVLNRVVLGREGEAMPPFVGIEPLATLNDCFVLISQLDYGPHAKHGCFLNHLFELSFF